MVQVHQTPRQSMADTEYLVRFKREDLPPAFVIAETIEFHGEHLVFLRSDGSLAAMFVLEVVENWSEVEALRPYSEMFVSSNAMDSVDP
jgi:hypothetical protein